MPKCNTLYWENFKLRIRPLGWRNILRFWPYLSGSKIEFKISISTKNKIKDTFHYFRDVSRWDGQKEIVNVCEPYQHEHKVPETDYSEIFTENLTIPGQYIIRAHLHHAIESSKRQVIANFTVFERDQYTTKWIIPIVTAVIGIILGYFFRGS
jgi:hypothetical protein